MTDVSKEAVDALLQGVTDGPWEAWPHDNDKTAEMFWYVSGNSHGIIVEVDEGDDGVVATSIGITAATVSANARFIAAARELVPAQRTALEGAEARAVKAEAALKDIDANLTFFLERKPQQMMLPETVEFVRDMSRAHLGAKPWPTN